MFITTFPVQTELCEGSACAITSTAGARWQHGAEQTEWMEVWLRGGESARTTASSCTPKWLLLPNPTQDWRLILDRNWRRQLSDLGTPGWGKGPSWKEGLCETPNTICLYTPMPTSGLVCCFIVMVLPSGRRCGDFCLRKPMALEKNIQENIHWGIPHKKCQDTCPITLQWSWLADKPHSCTKPPRIVSASFLNITR